MLGAGWLCCGCCVVGGGLWVLCSGWVGVLCLYVRVVVRACVCVVCVHVPLCVRARIYVRACVCVCLSVCL